MLTLASYVAAFALGLAVGLGHEALDKARRYRICKRVLAYGREQAGRETRARVVH